jgi:hypothetical protein
MAPKEFRRIDFDSRLEVALRNLTGIREVRSLVTFASMSTELDPAGGPAEHDSIVG